VKLALLTLDFPPAYIGGVSAWARDMAMALHQAGHEVTVFAKRTGDTRTHDEALPYAVHRVAGRAWSTWGGVWMRLRLLGRLKQYDQVLCATWPLAVHLDGHPRLGVAVHGSEVTCLEAAPSALRKLAQSAHAWFPVSHFLRSELDRLNLKCRKVEVLPMPLQTDTAPAIPRGDHLVCVARTTTRKGIDRALKIAEVTGRRIDLIGSDDGPPHANAHGELSRTDTLALVRSARALVLTPRTDSQGLGAEGLGLCMLEAASMGVPSIGCDTGGVSEALGPGLLLDNPDEPNGAAINAWLMDDGHGERAKAWVLKHHGPAQAVDTLMRGLL
jgi:glycosyltransferase involved in cell wall biosynthesis